MTFADTPFDFLLLESVIDGRVVLEPLGIGGKSSGAVCGLEILEIHDRLPGSLDVERVAIGLDESVDEIDA